MEQVSASSAESSIESLKEFEQEDTNSQRRTVKRWLVEWELSKKSHAEFHKNGKKLVELYKDKTDTVGEFELSQAHVKYNIFWSTIQTVRPALYSRTPKPIVERRVKEDDPIARQASMLIERVVRYYLQSYDFDSVMEAVVEDYLIPGRGQAWVRYVPTMKTETELIRVQEGREVPKGAELQQDEAGQFYENKYEEVAYEDVVCDYVYWEDFFHSPARRWADVRWVAKRVRMSKRDIEKRFGKKIANSPQLKYTSGHESSEEDRLGAAKHELFKKATVLEIWNKGDRKVYWISPECMDFPLDVQDDPLGLKGFFPCPQPITGTNTTDDFVPVADADLYRDILNELDKITKRISLLTEACKVFGAYDPNVLDMGEIFKTDENQFIPAQDWASIASQGGLAGVMDVFPVKPIAETLAILNDQKLKLLDDYYQISGFSDIIRGASSPHETATAQQIKGRFATLRLGSKQQEVQRFARDIIAIKAEIISEKFSPETLMTIANIPQDDPEQVEMFQRVLDLIQNDLLRRFRVIVETDSTIAVNEDIEKEERIEFLNMAGNFFGQAVGISEQTPEFLPTAMEMLKFGVRAFRAGRPLEESIEQGIKDYEARKIEEKENPQPSQEEKEMQQRAQLKEKEIQADFSLGQQKLEADYQQKMTEFQQKFQLKQTELQAEWQLEKDKTMMQLQTEREQNALNAEKARGELNLQMEKMRQELMLSLEKIQQEGAIRLQTEAIKAKAETDRGQPLSINVESNGSGKRTGTIKTLPDGSKRVEMQDG